MKYIGKMAETESLLSTCCTLRRIQSGHITTGVVLTIYEFVDYPVHF